MSEAQEEFNSTRKCAQCGKLMTILWPHQWAYKRGNPGKIKYYCSWSCLRASETKQEKECLIMPIYGRGKCGPEQEKEAIRLALTGGDPLRYIESLGITYAANKWSEIKAKVKDSDPETYAKLPARLPRKDARKKPETPETGTVADAMQGMKDAVETFLGPIETPEKPKITQPVVYDEMTVREVEGNFGRYRRSDVSGSTYIDFEVNDGADTLSYTIDQWRSFRKEQERAFMILGVEL